MVADGKLYLFDTNGKGYVFAPGRTMKLLASSDMGEGVFATPAFADGCMYVRGSKHLFAIGKAQ
jgi:outer membrane protein assembly factor BamB